MEIKKFKLLGEGFTGIEIEGTDVKHKEDTDVFVDLKMTYKVPVPADLIELLQGLKFYFLKITELLPEIAEDYFDHEYNLPKMKDYSKGVDKSIYAHTNKLIQNIFITGFRYDGNSVLITAKMKGFEDLTFAINTPIVQFAMIRVGFEDDLERLVRDIKKNVTNFVEDVKLRKMPARQYLLDLFQKDEEMRQSINGMSEAETEKMQIEKLTEKGFIVFKGEEVMEEIREISSQNEGIESVVEPEIVSEVFAKAEPASDYAVVEDKAEDIIDPDPVERIGMMMPETQSSVPVKKKNPSKMLKVA